MFDPDRLKDTTGPLIPLYFLYLLSFFCWALDIALHKYQQLVALVSVSCKHIACCILKLSDSLSETIQYSTELCFIMFQTTHLISSIYMTTHVRSFMHSTSGLSYIFERKVHPHQNGTLSTRARSWGPVEETYCYCTYLNKTFQIDYPGCKWWI